MAEPGVAGLSRPPRRCAASAALYKQVRLSHRQRGIPMARLDEKLTRIRRGEYRRADFIIADAKDPDMGPSIAAFGPARRKDGSSTRTRTREEFLEQIEAIVAQDVVDIMLISASNLDRLVQR